MSIFWVHDDCLGVTPQQPCVYVFDDESIAKQRWTLKRIGFIYECLLEMQVEIRRGDVPENVIEFALNAGAHRVVTMASPDPRVQDHIRRIERRLPVQSILPEPFVNIPPYTDLKRFSRYWQKAERLLITD